jgi:hypothetical protein
MKIRPHFAAAKQLRRTHRHSRRQQCVLRSMCLLAARSAAMGNGVQNDKPHHSRGA